MSEVGQSSEVTQPSRSERVKAVFGTLRRTHLLGNALKEAGSSPLPILSSLVGLAQSEGRMSFAALFSGAAFFGNTIDALKDNQHGRSLLKEAWKTGRVPGSEEVSRPSLKERVNAVIATLKSNNQVDEYLRLGGELGATLSTFTLIGTHNPMWSFLAGLGSFAGVTSEELMKDPKYRASLKEAWKTGKSVTAKTAVPESLPISQNR